MAEPIACNRLGGLSAASCSCRIPVTGWLPCPPRGGRRFPRRGAAHECRAATAQLQRRFLPGLWMHSHDPHWHLLDLPRLRFSERGLLVRAPIADDFAEIGARLERLI
jgi:hypothetical protein